MPTGFIGPKPPANTKPAYSAFRTGRRTQFVCWLPHSFKSDSKDLLPSSPRLSTPAHLSWYKFLTKPHSYSLFHSYSIALLRKLISNSASFFRVVLLFLPHLILDISTTFLYKYSLYPVPTHWCSQRQHLENHLLSALSRLLIVTIKGWKDMIVTKTYRTTFDVSTNSRLTFKRGDDCFHPSYQSSLQTTSKLVV